MRAPTMIAIATSTLLAACGTSLRVDVPAPEITNVQNQRVYCTTGDTNVDFGFDYSGSLSRVQIYFAPDGTTVTSNNASQYLAGEATATQDLFSFGTQHVSGSILATLSTGTANTGGSVTTQAIVVNPAVTYRLWVRGVSATGNATTFIPGQTVAPSGTDPATCDPNLTL